MRHLSLLGALAIATTFALPAHANWQHWSLDEHSTEDALTWNNSEGHSLDLDSAAGNGVAIVKIETADTHGLRAGDVILAVNGHAVKHVTDLINQANVNERGAVTLELQHGHQNRQVAIAGSDLYALIHPHP
jgi:S1-C subfamily serine protease